MIKKILEKIYKLLKWSEKYTKTDMIYLGKGGFWVTLRQFFTSISSLILTLFFANYLSKTEFGNYKYILSVYALLSISTISGLGIALTQAVSRKEKILLTPILKTKIKWGLVGFMLSLIVATYYLYKENSTLFYGMVLSAIFIPFIEPLNIYDAKLTGEKKFNISTKFQTITQIINTTSVIAAVVLKLNILIIILIFFISSLIPKIIIFKKMQQDEVKENTPEQKNITNKIISYGKHLSIIEIFSSFNKYIDKILIFQSLGSAELAIYTFAVSPPEYITTFFGNLQTVFLPKLSEKNEIKNVGKKIFLFLLTSIIISAIYIYITPLIFKIFFKSYTESVTLSQIYALSICTITLSIPLTIMQAKKQIKNLYTYNIITSVTGIIILFISIHYNLIGVIIGRVTIRFINLITAIILNKWSKEIS